MTLITFDEFSTQGLSGRLWKGFAPPAAMGPLGTTWQTPSGNPAFGFYDTFHSFQASTLEGPYLILGTDDDIEQVADTAEAKGIVQLSLKGDASSENDESVLQWGRGKGAPFKLADKDLVFECRMSMSAITASRWAVAVGLGEVGMGATGELLTDDAQILADNNFLGFVKLLAEAGNFDGAYKADGQTYQDGATKTKLDSLATFTASLTTYKRLGFRYRAHPKKVEWYVDNELPGGLTAPARLTKGEIDAATFPDDVFLAPIIGAKTASAETGALDINLDWWACAQLL